MALWPEYRSSNDRAWGECKTYCTLLDGETPVYRRGDPEDRTMTRAGRSSEFRSD